MRAHIVPPHTQVTFKSPASLGLINTFHKKIHEIKQVNFSQNVLRPAKKIQINLNLEIKLEWHVLAYYIICWYIVCQSVEGL